MPQPPYDDMVVVLTGATSGIGRAAAAEFDRRGSKLVLAARDAEELERLAASCRTEVEVCPTDVGEADEVEQLADRAVARFGRIDTWVNNAAVMAYGEFDAIPTDIFERVIRTNLLGQIHGSRAAVRQFREQGAGVLINVGSLWARVTSPLVSPYVVSKHGVRALSECIDGELVDEPDIHVAVIHPGAVDTPIFDHAANFLGRGLRPVWPIFVPSYVAEGIVECARKPKREVTYGKLARALELLYATSRPLYRRISPGMFMGATFTKESVPQGCGTVLEPQGDQQISGDWRSSRKGDLARAFVGAVKGALLGLFGRADRLKP